MDIRHYYIEKGAGFPLILLHGNGEDCGYFEHQMEPFAKHFRVIALDTRGHGQTPRGEAPFTIRQFAEDLLAFMDQQGIGKAHVLGFSDGGNIAMVFAMMHPERVEKLVLDGANLDPSGVKRKIQIPIEIGYRVAKLFSKRSPDARKNAELLGLMVNDPNVKPEELSRIQCPTLVIAGDKDMIKDKHTRLIAGSIPGAELSIIPGSHFVANKNPDAFNEAVLRFLLGRQDKTVKIRTNRFPASQEGIAEYHLTLQVEDGSLPFEGQLQAVLDAYSKATSGKTVLLRRFFLSDPAGQAGRLEAALRALPAAATSVIGQPPLDGTKIAAWVYAVEGGEFKDGIFTHNGYEHVWTGGMQSEEDGSEAQMAEIFKEYDSILAEKDMTVAENCIRTWIFVRDVDSNYGGVVKGRRDYFDRIGLTPDTHFISSTGIAGFSADPRQLVRMDAYSIKGLKDEQIQYLHAYDYLSPTALYGVTFERGTAVTYGDRKHIFISGTASIDKEGNVLHVDDPRKQTERMLENVDALLKEAEAGFEDIQYSIVYLRNATDYQCVCEVLQRDCPNLNPIYVLAPVCRPTWLVEMECMAVTGDGDKSFESL